MTVLVPLLLVGVAVLLMAASHMLRQRRELQKAAAAASAPAARILIHSINDDRCTGCDACVAVCPTDVLELVSNKSRVLRFGDCIQCEQCMFACPTQALVMHYDDAEPPPLKVPHLDPFYQTGVIGQYLIGEVAGKPLVKNAANVGRAVVEHMVREGLRPGGARKRRAEGSDSGEATVVDVVIVGSGPGGLSAALTCMHHGLSFVVLEKEQVVASTIARYPKGKDVMAEPYDVRNVSFLPVFDCTKEEMVALWSDLVKRVGLGVRMGEAVESVQRAPDGGFDVRTTVAAYRGQRVVLATGTRGKPRTLGCAGENLPKVQSLLDDPDLYKGRDVLVVGGGDSAVEAACALADAGARVTLSYRGKQFNRAQAKNRERVTRYAKDKKIAVYFGSSIAGFTEADMVVRTAEGQDVRLPNQAAFVLIGSDPPVAWLEKMGVEFVERPHWYALGATDQLVESIIGRVSESPKDVGQLAALLGKAARPVSPAEARPPVPEPSVMRPLPVRPSERPRTLPGIEVEDAIFTSAHRPEAEPTLIAGLSLQEFAKRAAAERSSGGGRKKKVRTQEETRILRALRDEGARLAHDETNASLVQVASADIHTSFSEVSGVHVGPAPAPVPVPRAPAPRPAPRASAPPPAASRGPTVLSADDVSGLEVESSVSVSSPFSSAADEHTVFVGDPRLSQRGAPPPAAPPPQAAPAAPAVQRKKSPTGPPPAAPPLATGLPPAGPPPAAPPLDTRRPLTPPPPSRGPSGPQVMPKAKFVEARTTAASPEFIDEMRRVATDAGGGRGGTEADAPDRTDQQEIEIVSRDPDDEAAAAGGDWVLDESTSLADPNMVERLRDQLRRK